MKVEKGHKVIYRDEVYDFGYVSGTGHVILYEEGESNMQDSFVVENPEEIEVITTSITLTGSPIEFRDNRPPINMSEVYNPFWCGNLQQYIDSAKYTVEFETKKYKDYIN